MAQAAALVAVRRLTCNDVLANISIMFLALISLSAQCCSPSLFRQLTDNYVCGDYFPHYYYYFFPSHKQSALQSVGIQVVNW